MFKHWNTYEQIQNGARSIMYNTQNQLWQHSKECICRQRNKACDFQQKCDYQKSVTTRQTDGQTDRKVIPMCPLALQVIQKSS